MHSKGEIRGGYENFFEKFSFFSAKSPFFHHQNLKKGTFCAKIKKKYFCIPEIKLGEEMINILKIYFFNAKYAIFDH